MATHRKAAPRRKPVPRRKPGRNAGLTHLDAAGKPTMVDVGAKAVTARIAVAEARVLLPGAVARALAATGHRTRKGPVFDTAIIAGVQAVKRTHELIPFCHPLPIEHIAVTIEATGRNQLRIACSVGATHKTGVEMEALVGASVAALTVYDMCKALSHEIRISEVKLVHKRGGKRDVGKAAPLRMQARHKVPT